MFSRSPVEKVLDGKSTGGAGLKSIESYRWFFWAASRIPFVSRWHPWVKPSKTDMRWIPINEDINRPEDAPVPLELLDRMIGEASHRAVFDRCGCRAAFGCRDYPIDIGCLLMGDSALESPSRNWREVSPEDARGHVRQAVDAGLVPVMGKARIDNYLFGIKDRHQLLTVCFCCECCCITRATRYTKLEQLESLFPRLEGVSVSVTGDCTGCGKCAQHCYLGAIEITDGRAVISDYCRACGRCATVCPEGAISVEVSDPEYLDKTYGRIRSYVDYE